MSRHLIIYGLGFALHRGASIFILPFATNSLTLAEFGAFSLAQVFIQLAHPLFCLNGAEAVVREGAEDFSLGDRIFWRFNRISLLIAAVVLPLAYFFVEPIWLKYGLMSAVAEGFHWLILSLYRSQDKSTQFGLFTGLKALLLIGIFIIAWQFGLGLEFILFWQFVTAMVTYLVFMAPYAFKRLNTDPIWQYLPYCLLLIPNSVGQWLLSSSDRFVIDAFIDKTAVGEYSIGYNLALVIMLVNAGLGHGLAPVMFRDYDHWVTARARLGLFLKTALGCIAIYCALVAFIYVDYNFTKFVVYPANALNIIVWIFSGLFLLSFYYYFANFTYYHRKPQLLFRITLSCGITNVILSIPGTIYFGIIGAAVATFITYLLFLGYAIFTARHLEPRLKITTNEVLIMVTGLAVIFTLPSLFAQWLPYL